MPRWIRVLGIAVAAVALVSSKGVAYSEAPLAAHPHLEGSWYLFDEVDP